MDVHKISESPYGRISIHKVSNCQPHSPSAHHTGRAWPCHECSWEYQQRIKRLSEENYAVKESKTSSDDALAVCKEALGQHKQEK